jgi:AraC family transcriptional regulator
MSDSARDFRDDAFATGTDGWRKYPSSTLLATSAGRGWSTISAELRTHPVGTITSFVQQNVEVVIAIDGVEDGLVIRNGAGRQQETRSASGTVWLVPIGIGDEEIIITAPIPKLLHLYLPVRQFELLSDQYNLAQCPVHSIQYLGGLRDELIREIGVSVLSELTEQTSTGRMFVETSSLMLAARLAHDYAGSNFVDRCVGRDYRLDNARLRRVLDHIEQHLEDEITVSGLAAQAHLSEFHFTRMFTAAIGIPPHRYVSRRRLENAMAFLAAGRLPLSEIAHRSGFSSQASFNRAFRRVTGMTPGEYRRHLR